MGPLTLSLLVTQKYAPVITKRFQKATEDSVIMSETLITPHNVLVDPMEVGTLWHLSKALPRPWHPPKMYRAHTHDKKVLVGMYSKRTSRSQPACGDRAPTAQERVP